MVQDVPCWLNQPSILFDPPRSLLDICPFIRGRGENRRLNALTRLVLYAGAALAVYYNNLRPLIMAVLIVLLLGVLQCNHPANNCKNCSPPLIRKVQAPPPGMLSYRPAPRPAPAERNPYAGTQQPREMSYQRVPRVHGSQMRSMQLTKEAIEALDLREDLRGAPVAFDGSLASIYPAAYHSSTYANNPQGNPSPFDFDRAVRSGAPEPKVIPPNWLARLYNPPGMIPYDMIAYPIPDPTFSARTPFWNESSEADRHIVQDSCNQRVCR